MRTADTIRIARPHFCRFEDLTDDLERVSKPVQAVYEVVDRIVHTLYRTVFETSILLPLGRCWLLVIHGINTMRDRSAFTAEAVVEVDRRRSCPRSLTAGGEDAHSSLRLRVSPDGQRHLVGSLTICCGELIHPSAVVKYCALWSSLIKRYTSSPKRVLY